MHPAIRTLSATHLGATTTADEPPPAAGGVGGRARAAVRRVGGAVLDRVGDRAASATAEQVEQLRDELERTRAELGAEVELLRAELEALRDEGRADG
jgi:hypothetical protein